jgi:hypothetical protein
LAPGVSSVRYPIRQLTFKYVATVQSVTDETCQFETFRLRLATSLSTLTDLRPNESYRTSLPDRIQRTSSRDRFQIVAHDRARRHAADNSLEPGARERRGIAGPRSARR